MLVVATNLERPFARLPHSSRSRIQLGEGVVSQALLPQSIPPRGITRHGEFFIAHLSVPQLPFCPAACP